MSLKDTDVKTPGEKAIAKKFKLSLAKVRQLVKVGAKHEKEHNTNQSKAEQVARDHIGERPDYYKMLKKAEKTDKNHMKEETYTTAVGGLGFNTGTPAIDSDNKYTTTNAMDYVDWNGNILKMINDKHNQHLKDMGLTSYSPNEIKNHPNRVVKETKLNELGEYDNKGGTTGAEGLTDAPPKKDIKEGWASVGHPFTRDGRVNPNAQFYGGKPKQTTTKNDEKDKTYDTSKQGGRVKLVKKNSDTTVSEDAAVAATQHMDTAQSGYHQSAKPSPSRVNLRGTTAHVKGAEYRSGTGSARASFGASGQLKADKTNVPTRFMRSVKNAPTTQGASGQMKPTSTSGSSSFTPNSQSRSMNVGKGMGMSKQTSPVVKGMSAAGTEASKKIVPKAASVMATVGKAARALSGPEGAAVTAAAEPLAKKMASSYKAGHQSFASHGSEGEKTSTVFARMKQPSQGRSISQYEKDVLTPKASEPAKAPRSEEHTSELQSH